MLNHLRINNFALIDELEIQLNKGLTTITGETGAGKSIILGALKLVLGERADLSSVKNKDKKCIIEATFSLNNKTLKSKLKPLFKEFDLDFDEDTILRREILPSEKSRAFVNDTPVNLKTLNQISEQLIDIHSQFNTAELLAFEYQIEILDLIAQNHDLLSDYQQVLKEYQTKKKQLTDSKQRFQELQNNADYSNFLLNELEEANLVDENLEQLENDEQELSNANQILESLSEINQQIDNENFGLDSAFRDIANKLQRLSELSNNFSSINERFESLKIEFFDFSEEISQLADSVESNPESLETIRERIDAIQNLFRKHQVNSIEDLLEIQYNLQSENSDFEELTNEILALEKELIQIESKLNFFCKELNENRKKVIPKVEKSILESLSKLGMENSQIQFKIEEIDNFKSNGKDKITLLFSANKGIQPKEIEKAVSGGERSRLMLSIKQLIATHQSLPTLIFDEIDTGVSGKVADEMGNVMLQMAKTSQIISITHLPQVASKGNHQLKVYKDKSESKTMIQELNNDERLLEIASLISGDKISESAKEQAKELLNL